MEEQTESDLAFIEKAIAKHKEKIMTTSLSRHIHKVWLENQEYFKPVRAEMVKTLRRSRGEYETQKLADIRAFRGSEAFVRSSEAKCRAAVSWIKDLYNTTDSMWEIAPTPSPELPDETSQTIFQDAQAQAVQFEQQVIAQGLEVDREAIAELLTEYHAEKIEEAKQELVKDAKKRCKAASVLIADSSKEGGWDKAFDDFLYYFVRLKFGVIKGHTLVRKKKHKWVATEAGYQFIAEDSLVNDVYCVSPFNFYPSKDSKTTDNCDIIEIHELTRQNIADLIGVPSYSDEKVKAVLAEYDEGKLKKDWFVIEDESAVRDVSKDLTAERKNANRTGDVNNAIKAQEFYGSVSGKMLIEWGMDNELDPHAQYQVNCWKIGQHVIKAVVNPDPLGRKPYHLSSWSKNPDSIVGEGLMEFGAPIEDAMNAVMRALLNNIAIASGPMAEIDTDRVDTALPIYPWRQIESTTTQMKNSGPAVNYYQPQMHSQELINAWQFLSRVLDEMTVPAYAQGASQSGVTTGTATVFTQLLAAASRSIKSVVSNIDKDIIIPYVQMKYDFLMSTTDDPTVKGDAQIIAKGVSGLSIKEQQAQRKVEYLQAAANPTFQEILGSKNIASILAQIAKSNDIELPDMDRLEGSMKVEERVSQMLLSQAGVDPMQENGQVASGSGNAPKGKTTNPDGSKAGVNNG